MKRFYYPLTHAQKRIWYTEQFYLGTSIANLSGFLKLRSHEGMDCSRKGTKPLSSKMANQPIQ